MKLRSQLILLGLFTLILPWAGCQYAQDMNDALILGQVNALQSKAHAISINFSNIEAIRNEIVRLSPQDKKNTFYAHTLQSDISIDGYSNDWQQQKLAHNTLKLYDNNATTPAKHIDYISGHKNERAFLFFTVKNTNIHYYKPGVTTLIDTDYILLDLLTEKGNQSFIFPASAPGNINSYQYDPSTQTVGKIEPAILAAFRENHLGYQIEISLPKKWFTESFTFSLHSTSKQFGSTLQQSYPQTFISRSPLLESLTTKHLNRGETIQVTNRYLDLIAYATKDESQTNHLSTPLESRIYKLFLKRRKTHPVQPSLKSGRVSNIDTSLSPSLSNKFVRINGNSIIRIAEPIFKTTSPLPIGYIVLDISANSLTSQTDRAFNRLIRYSLLISILVVIALIGYASIISMRIRRLSHAAQEFTIDSNNPQIRFPALKSADEIGELSRNYAQLLNRVNEYTQYLKTLSSKLSHELRTPLAIVKSSLDNLDYEPLPPSAKAFSNRAKEGAHRLSRILTSMSSATRVEQAIHSSEKETIDCKRLINDLVEAYKGAYPKNAFQLHITHSELPFSVFGSPELLVQMLDKLIDNAVSFCPKDKPIELHLEKQETHIVLKVINHGPPLPNHMKNQLFDSLVSIREKPQKNTYHLGLGLYIVKLIIDDHQGLVYAKNNASNQGVTFEIHLPAVSPK